jgi:hypothetical protein
MRQAKYQNKPSWVDRRSDKIKLKKNKSKQILESKSKTLSLKFKIDKTDHNFIKI